MTQGKEQEQLLADASTLLMFASAAARQGSSPQTNANQTGAVTSENATLSRHSAPQILPESEQKPPQGIEAASQSGTVPLTGRMHHVSSAPPYSKAPFSPLSSAAPPQLPRPGQGSLPHLQSLAMAGNTAQGQKTRNQGPGGYLYSPQMAHSSLHGTHSGPPPGFQNLGPFAFYGRDTASGSVSAPFQQAFPATYPLSNPAQMQVPMRRQSLAQSSLLNEPSAQKLDIRKTQSASPQDGASDAKKPARLVALSPKVAHVEKLQFSADPAGPGHELPARGSFVTAHKRTPSGSGTKRGSVSSPGALSPNINNLPYSRGINVESGKRSSDNAMIAAAALAAAADIPFPLKNKEKRGAIPGDNPNAELGPPMHITGGVIDADTDAKGVSVADSAATEPEEDENKTEDEAMAGPTQAASPKSEKPDFEPVPPLIKTDLNSESLAGSGFKAEASFPEKKPADCPPLASYKVDPDAGIIGCICAIDEDDGFTIQCDVCFRWQHCSCMGYLTNEEVPEDEYKCYYCDEQKWNTIDAEKCREATIARLDMDRNSDVPDTPAPPKRKTSSSGNEEKKRRKSEKEPKVNSEKVGSDKRKQSGGTSPDSISAFGAEIRNKDNPLLEEGVSAEAYSGVYYRLEENDYKTPAVRNRLAKFGARHDKSSRFSETMSLHQFKQTKLSRVSLPSHQKYLQERNEIRKHKGVNKTVVRVQAYSENPKQKFVSVQKVGLFITEKGASGSAETIIAAGTPVIEYLGEVDMFGSHVANKTNQYTPWGTVKPRVAKITLENSEKDRVAVVVDSRFVGNEARFIRRSCVTTANCEIRPVYVPQQQAYRFLVVTSKNIALKGENFEEELRLPWEWDPSHPISQMIRSNDDGTYEDGKKFEDFSDEQKSYLISCVDTILNFVECACNTSSINNQCAIFKVKKATSYLLRSNRKASSLGGNVVVKSKDELVMPKKVREYASWKQRLEERDLALLAESNYATLELKETFEAKQDEADTSVLKEGEAVETSSSKDEKAQKAAPRNTFRQELLAQHLKNSHASYEVVSPEPKSADASAVKLDTPPLSLPVPLTSEVLAKIKRQVNEAFMPLQKIHSNVSITADVTEVVPEQAKEASVSSDAPSPVAHKPVVEVVSSEAKPAVKKKLSFADYKKKMK